jgi:hypothetical protein
MSYSGLKQFAIELFAACADVVIRTSQVVSHWPRATTRFRMARSAICKNRFLISLLFLFSVALTTQASLADEGGVSFWLPGQFGSLAAGPQQPGWSIGAVYYHTSVDAGGDVAAARQASIGRLNPTVNVNLSANLDARPDLVFVAPRYVFASPMLGGQLAVGMRSAAPRPLSMER